MANSKLKKIFFCLLICANATTAIVQAVEIDMTQIMMIESSGNPLAFNSGSEARGLFQITPICLKEWNNFHPSEKHTKDELFNPIINKKIACWYVKRIKQMLRYYKKEETVDNILTCYNAGVSYVVHNKALPTETKAYIAKYKQGGNHDSIF